MKASRNLQRLFDETEELLMELEAEHTPDVHELRERLQQSISHTKDVLSRHQAEPQVKFRDVAGSLNDYVRNFPWLALATGVLVASTIGILSTGATRRSIHR